MIRRTSSSLSGLYDDTSQNDGISHSRETDYESHQEKRIEEEILKNKQKK